MLRSFALAALAAASVAPAALAQNATQDRPATATGRTAAPGQVAPSASGHTAEKRPVSDPLFAAAAATGGLTEVTLAELGEQKATNPELKKFSQHMIAEHTKMNAELMALATQKSLPLPKTLPANAAFCAQSLAGLSGEDFDACYAKAQLVVHMDSLAAFEAEAERGQDADMKALAAKGVPHIKEHLKMIKPIAMKYEEKMKEKKGEK